MFSDVQFMKKFVQLLAQVFMPVIKDFLHKLNAGMTTWARPNWSQKAIFARFFFQNANIA